MTASKFIKKTVPKIRVGTTTDFPANLGICVKVAGTQIAIFYIPSSEQQWFAIDNFNPQNERMVLSRGIIGDSEGTHFVACPLHKYRFALTSGACLTDEQFTVNTYPITIEGDEVSVGE